MFGPKWVLAAFDGRQEAVDVYRWKWEAKLHMKQLRKEEPHVIFIIERLTPTCSVAHDLGHLGVEI